MPEPLDRHGLRCGVLGDPIAHSLSPVLHRAGYDAVGLDWRYDTHRVPAGTLGEFLSGLGEGWRGCSLTMPLKRELLGLVTDVSDRARRAGAANTLLIDQATGGRSADNTDIPGAVAALREHYDGPVTEATILGGGATAASTLLALAELGCRTFRLAVRNPARAGETLEAAGRYGGLDVEVVALDTEPTGEVLVSTIPVDAQAPELVARCAGMPVVFEVLYDPWPTPLAAAAEGVLVGGLDLLVHQAAVQFELFTGLPAPLTAMRAAGERALAERSAR